MSRSRELSRLLLYFVTSDLARWRNAEPSGQEEEEEERRELRGRRRRRGRRQVRGRRRHRGRRQVRNRRRHRRLRRQHGSTLGLVSKQSVCRDSSNDRRAFSPTGTCVLCAATVHSTVPRVAESPKGAVYPLN